MNKENYRLLSLEGLNALYLNLYLEYNRTRRMVRASIDPDSNFYRKYFSKYRNSREVAMRTMMIYRTRIENYVRSNYPEKQFGLMAITVKRPETNEVSNPA